MSKKSVSKIEIPFSKEEIEEITFESPDGWKEVSSVEMIEYCRHVAYYSKVISNGIDFYQIDWAIDADGLNHDETTIHRTIPYLETVTKYKKVNKP